ncbi:MAG: hypothetical protein WC748_06725 [Legionellales bacterium]|jgi:ankyrin repeat protein
MPPIIFINTGLYPHYKTVANKVVGGEKFKDNEHIPYKDYADVLFPVVMLDGEGAQDVDSYVPLIHLAVAYKNEGAFKQLFTQKCDLNITDPKSYSLFQFAIEMATGDHSNQKIVNIVNLLLDAKTIDFNLGVLLRGHTPTQYLSQKGDKYPTWMKKLLANAPDFSSDLYGANPLTYSLQEAQYETATVILSTAQGRLLLSQSRADGTLPLNIACEYLTEENQGIAVLQTMLNTVDPNLYYEKHALVSAFLNTNPKCRLRFTELLLQKGADLTLTNVYGESILQIAVSLYMGAEETENKTDADSYFQIVSLLLKHIRILEFDENERNKALFNAVLKSKWPRLISTFKEFFKDDLQVQSIISSVPDSEKGTFEFSGLQKELHAVRNEENSFTRQQNFLSMHEKYQEDYEKNVFIHNLILQFRGGNLAPENIIKLINLLKDKEEFKKYIPFLYREYLGRAIIDFDFSSANQDEKQKSLVRLFLCFYQWTTYLPYLDNRARKHFLLEINDLAQRIIQLALLSARGNGIDGLDKFLVWIDRIDGQYFDDETKLMVWQLRMTDAYFSLNKDKFNFYYQDMNKYLPQNHLLRRQYDYWNAKLVFRQADKETLETLESAHDKLQSYDFDLSLMREFNTTLAEFRKKKTVTALPKKPKERIEYIPPPPVVTSSYNNSSSSSSSSSSFISNNNSSEPDLPPKTKIKTRGPEYIALQNNALAELAQRADPNILVPVHSEEEVRRIFRHVLKEGDVLKPISYENKYGVFWAVCNFDELRLQTAYEERFRKEFEKSNIVRFGASSGLSLEKTFRLKLGHNDPRLHSTLYKTQENTCSLIKFDEFWLHDRNEFERRTVDIAQFQPSPSKSFKF